MLVCRSFDRVKCFDVLHGTHALQRTSSHADVGARQPSRRPVRTSDIPARGPRGSPSNRTSRPAQERQFQRTRLLSRKRSWVEAIHRMTFRTHSKPIDTSSVHRQNRGECSVRSCDRAFRRWNDHRLGGGNHRSCGRNIGGAKARSLLAKRFGRDLPAALL
jgi:hypothetical protein